MPLFYFFLNFLYLISLLLSSFMKKPDKTVHKRRDDILRVPRVWMSSAIYSVTSRRPTTNSGESIERNRCKKKELGSKTEKVLRRGVFQYVESNRNQNLYLELLSLTALNFRI
jgi:hypothetical protein